MNDLERQYGQKNLNVPEGATALEAQYGNHPEPPSVEERMARAAELQASILEAIHGQIKKLVDETAMTKVAINQLKDVVLQASKDMQDR